MKQTFKAQNSNGKYLIQIFPDKNGNIFWVKGNKNLIACFSVGNQIKIFHRTRKKIQNFFIISNFVDKVKN